MLWFWQNGNARDNHKLFNIFFSHTHLLVRRNYIQLKIKMNTLQNRALCWWEDLKLMWSNSDCPDMKALSIREAHLFNILSWFYSEFIGICWRSALILSLCGGLNNGPSKILRVLIPRTCEYISLYSKRGFCKCH